MPPIVYILIVIVTIPMYEKQKYVIVVVGCY